MANNTNNNNENKNENKLVSIVETKPAVVPKELSEKQIADIKSQAEKAIITLVSANGTEEITIADQISNIGVQDQKNISTGIALLQERMGKIFYSDNKSSVTDNMSKDITELQTVLARINPEDIKKEAKYRIIAIIPFFGNKIINVLKTSSDRRLTLQQFVEHLNESLKTGEIMLRQDNAQLKVMYSDVETKQNLVVADAYFAEVLIEKLTEEIAKSTDEKKKGKLNKVLFKLATRAQDLRAMENIHEQFFVSIEMTKDNNDLLIDSVRRMLTMGMNVVYVSMAIHAALIRAKNVKDVAVGTGEFIGNMLVSNAVVVNGMVNEIGDLYKRPFVPMDKLEKAVAQLEQAIDTSNKLKLEGIERAKENIVRVKILTDEIKTKAEGLPDNNIKSLEASKTLMLSSGSRTI